MAWTSPMTFVSNNVLTAAQMNTHLRDNMLETAPAKATTNQGSWFVSQGPNRLEERLIRTARVTSLQVTKSTSYTDLGTKGPTVTLKTGTTAIVMLQTMLGVTTADASASMSFAVTGDTTRDPSDSYAISVSGLSANTHGQWGVTYYVDDLTEGLNTFICKYKAGSDQAEFTNRFIGVIAL
jgi:hypothetical protein